MHYRRTLHLNDKDESSINNSVHVLEIPEKISQEFAVVKSAISNIQESIRVLAESIGVFLQSSTLDNASANVNNQSQQSVINSSVNSSFLVIVKPITYVHAVKQDLKSVVKTAVAEAIKKQRMDDRGKASIVIYGFSDKGNDYEDVLNLLSNMRCNISVLSLTRFGRISSTLQSNV